MLCENAYKKMSDYSTLTNPVEVEYLQIMLQPINEPP